MAHDHTIYDSDQHYSINPITRAITNSSPSAKVILMQNDHNSERFSFDIPRMIEGHDLLECTEILVHYTNTDVNKRNSNIGVYEVDDIKVADSYESMLTFSWLISENATLYPGTLSFLISFACVENGICIYRWNTGINNTVTIAKGMNNGDAITESYPDLLAKWKTELFAAVLGYKTVHIGPTPPDTYPYWWLDTSNGYGDGVGIITIKDADGNVQQLYPMTKLESIDGLDENLDKRMAAFSETINELSVGLEQHKHVKADITDFPTPKTLTVRFNGADAGSYNTNIDTTINITPEGIGASPNTHTHSMIRTKATKSVTIEVADWTENTSTGRFESLVEASEISADNIVIMSISDAQKGAYVFGFDDPLDGSILAYVQEVPGEPLIFKMKILEQVEG